MFVRAEGCASDTRHASAAGEAGTEQTELRRKSTAQAAGYTRQVSGC